MKLHLSGEFSEVILLFQSAVLDMVFVSAGDGIFSSPVMIDLPKVNFFCWASIGTKFGCEFRSYLVAITHTTFGGTGVAASRRG